MEVSEGEEDVLSSVLFQGADGNKEMGLSLADNQTPMSMQGLDMEGPPNVSLVQSSVFSNPTQFQSNRILQSIQIRETGSQGVLNLAMTEPSYTAQDWFSTDTSAAVMYYPDIRLQFQDGSVEMNRAVLAVFSSLLASSILEDEEVDVVLVPDLQLQTFLDLLNLHSKVRKGSELDPSSLSEALMEAIHFLDCKLFLSPAQFNGSLCKRERHVETKQSKRQEEPFLPGYSFTSPSYSATTPRISIESCNADQTKTEPKNESFIAEAESIEAVKKRRPGRPPKNRLGEADLSAEMKVAEAPGPEDPTLDHVIKGFLSCHSCHEADFSHLSELILHFSQVHGWAYALDHCVFCDTPFMDKAVAAKHEKDKCLNVDNVCYKCERQLGSKQELLEHLVREHRTGVRRKCPHCEEQFLTLAPLSNSRWKHPEQCPARPAPVRSTKSGAGHKICQECGGTYSDSWKHRRQCTSSNRDIKHICFSCKKGFRRLGTLKKHFLLISKCKLDERNQREYMKLLRFLENNVKGKTICTDCGLELSTRKGSLEHRKNCSAFTRFKCHACNRGMNALDGFHIHFSKYPACRQAKENKEIVAELMARSVKPDFHVCHLCGAQYKAKESIDKHMLTHSENLVYLVCPEVECGKKFLTPKSMEMHMKNHAMPMVICSVCGKQVKQGSLALHMVLHTGKKVACPVCAKLFQHKGVLNKHFKACHMEKKGESRRRKRKVEEDGKTDIVLEPAAPQTVQVELQAGLTGTGGGQQIVKVSIPQLMMGREMVGLVTAASGQVVSAPQVLNADGQPVHVALPSVEQGVQVSIPVSTGVQQQQALVHQHQYQRLVVPSTVDIQQFIQISGQQNPDIIP